MRAFMVAAVLGVGGTLGAQAPAPPPQGAPAPSPSSFEFRVGGFMLSGDRSYEFFNSVQTATGSVRGVDVLLRGKGGGIMVRSMSGTFGDQPHVTSADARLLLFPRVFSIMIGAGRRVLWSDLNATSPSQYDLAVGGVSSTLVIGGSGLSTNISAAMFAPVGKATQDKLKSGMEGEASVIYHFPVVPVFVQLGYRTEVFTAKNPQFEVPEETRGIRLGGGLLLGGR